jgi:rhamnosyltransferase subunit B
MLTLFTLGRSLQRKHTLLQKDDIVRILIMALGSLGDNLPFMALGAELARRGHEVRLYGNGYFQRHAEERGLHFTATSAAIEYENFLNSPAATNPKEGMRLVAASVMARVEASHRIMAQDVLPGQTIAIASTFAFAPRLLRETHGIPVAVIHLSPSVLRSEYCAPRFSPLGHMTALPRFVKRFIWRTMDSKFMDPLYTVPFNQIRTRLGLPPVARMFHQWLHQADTTLCMAPDWFAERQPDWPVQLEMSGFPMAEHGEKQPLPRELTDFIDAGPAPVVITAGTANAVSHAFFSSAIAACRLLGKRAIVVTSDPKQLPSDLPDGMIHVSYAPFAALLPHALAFIHHGGIGSVSQALRAGVPQLIQPMAFDQFDNASRVTQLGAGTEILPRHFAPERVARSLDTLVTDASIAASCKQYKDLLQDADGITQTCNRLLETLNN